MGFWGGEWLVASGTGEWERMPGLGSGRYPDLALVQTLSTEAG
jgi:hypothetical protein